MSRGPQWVGPEGLGRQAFHQPAGTGLPTLDDDGDGDRGRVGRRRALVALGGTAAVVAGGAALAMSPQVRSLFGDDAVAGDATGATVTDGTPARPSGQQPSTVRTYTEQNESYMGSRAGAALKKNSPNGGRTFSGPAAAAAETPVTVKTVLAKDPIRHLASRATFGATPKVLADIKRMGIDAWVRQQLDPEKIAPTPGRAEARRAAHPEADQPSSCATSANSSTRGGRSRSRRWSTATLARQIWSERQLFEVMVDFWNDFLHVAADFDGGEAYRNSFDRDVVRKHALGSYPEMLVAANRHPALLLYLNQNDSRADAVNENLARENLELYSVGVDGGYTEKDVRQAALLQTGRGVDDGKYVFRTERHYVGKVKILGFSHPNDSADPRKADAGHRRVPHVHRAAPVDRPVRGAAAWPPGSSRTPRRSPWWTGSPRSYTANKGTIKPLLMSLFSSSEFWAAVGQKVRRPMEYLVATYRTLGVGPQAGPGFRQGDSTRTAFAQGLRQIHDKLRELGQYPMGQPTPDGYPDVYVAWTSAGTMVNGWNEAADLIAGRRTHVHVHHAGEAGGASRRRPPGRTWTRWPSGWCTRS